MVRVWVEVQDKTGDRLSEDMLINGWLEYEQDKDAPIVNGWVGGERVVYYDENSRTALIEIYEIGPFDRGWHGSQRVFQQFPACRTRGGNG